MATLRHDRKRQIHCFSKTPGGGLDELPAGYEVLETETTGLPMLKKKAAEG